MNLNINAIDLEIGDRILCKQLNLIVSTGQFWAIVGKNGVGKTTLLKALCNLHALKNGSITLKKNNSLENNDIKTIDTKDLARFIGLMQQDYEYFFPCTVIEAVLMSRFPYLSAWQFETTEDYQIAQHCLQITKLEELQNRQVKTLSGGEKRRLHLAMLMSQSPDFFLLDEPTNHLDLATQMQFMELLKSHFNKNNKAGIMVSHDINLVSRYCDHVLLLFDDGEWLSGTTKEIMNEKNLSLLLDYPVMQTQINQHRHFVPA
ncbi:MAG: ABC transporter ATP-binding protein [Pseudomonadota bacterium]